MTNWYDNVPAPVDANGREVPLDTKELVYKGETRGVVSIAYNLAIGMWMVIFDSVVECPHLTHCTLPDSWERLEEDAEKDSCSYFEQVESDDHSCYDCPAHNKGCTKFMIHDVVRRAKALAGVTDGE